MNTSVYHPAPQPNQHLQHARHPLAQPQGLTDKLISTAGHSFCIKINQKHAERGLQVEAMLAGSRQIRPKMVTKVLAWLEKLCRETLGFSTQTLQLAARILVEYLAVVDEPVSNLQLLGCTCLYLSSKILERTVIAAESYAECSCNIFSGADLMEKQAQVYKTIHAGTDIATCLNIYQFLREECLGHMISDEQDQEIHKIIHSCIKDVELLGLNPCQLAFNIIKLVLDGEAQLDFQAMKSKLLLPIFFNKK